MKKLIERSPTLCGALLMAITLLLPMQVAQADDYTQIMDKHCRAEPESRDWLLCGGYFLGAIHMSVLMQTVAEQADVAPTFCANSASDAWPSADIIRRLWINFIDDNPKMLAEPIFVSYIQMMKKEYPCEDES